MTEAANKKRHLSNDLVVVSGVLTAVCKQKKGIPPKPEECPSELLKEVVWKEVKNHCLKPV